MKKTTTRLNITTCTYLADHQSTKQRALPCVRLMNSGTPFHVGSICRPTAIDDGTIDVTSSCQPTTRCISRSLPGVPPMVPVQLSRSGRPHAWALDIVLRTSSPSNLSRSRACGLLSTSLDGPSVALYLGGKRARALDSDCAPRSTRLEGFCNDCWEIA